MKVTPSGQVTIPPELQEKAGLTPGSEVEFVQEDDGRLVLRKAHKGSGAALVAHLRGRGDVRMSTDEILALTREPR